MSRWCGRSFEFAPPPERASASAGARHATQPWMGQACFLNRKPSRVKSLSRRRPPGMGFGWPARSCRRGERTQKSFFAEKICTQMSNLVHTLVQYGHNADVAVMLSKAANKPTGSARLAVRPSVRGCSDRSRPDAMRPPLGRARQASLRQPAGCGQSPRMPSRACSLTRVPRRPAPARP